jgi:CheY-like chemotaxis protein
MQQREILCIDDDVQSLGVRKLLLETFDFRVITATSGREGLKLFRSRKVDAVILDYQMPEMDGGEVARRLKDLRPQVPVLMLSALPWLPEEAPQHCIDLFVTKGDPTSKLVSELEQLIAAAPPEAKAKLRASRVAGTVLGAVAAKVRGVTRARPSAPVKALSQAPARTN